MYKYLTLLYCFVLAVSTTIAQEDEIRVVGSVYDPNINGLNYNLMVINRSKGVGTYGAVDGTFNIIANKSDTILLSTRNYKLIKLCFNDSAQKRIYNLRLPLEALKYEIKPVTIFAERDLSEIKKDIDQLGYTKKITCLVVLMRHPAQ